MVLSVLVVFCSVSGVSIVQPDMCPNVVANVCHIDEQCHIGCMLLFALWECLSYVEYTNGHCDVVVCGFALTTMVIYVVEVVVVVLCLYVLDWKSACNA